jgi:hypothetical protein
MCRESIDEHGTGESVSCRGKAGILEGAKGGGGCQVTSLLVHIIMKNQAGLSVKLGQTATLGAGGHEKRPENQGYHSEGRELTSTETASNVSCPHGRTCTRTGKHTHKSGALKAYARRKRENVEKPQKDKTAPDEKKKTRYNYCNLLITECPIDHGHVERKGRVKKGDLRYEGIDDFTLNGQIRVETHLLTQSNHASRPQQVTPIQEDEALASGVVRLKKEGKLGEAKQKEDVAVNGILSSEVEMKSGRAANSSVAHATPSLGCALAGASAYDFLSIASIIRDPWLSEPEVEVEALVAEALDLREVILFQESGYSGDGKAAWWERVLARYTFLLDIDVDKPFNHEHGVVLSEMQQMFMKDKPLRMWFWQNAWRETELELRRYSMDGRYDTKRTAFVEYTIVTDIMVDPTLWKRSLLEGNKLRPTAVMCIKNLISQHPLFDRVARHSTRLVVDTQNFILNQLLVRGLEMESHVSTATHSIEAVSVKETYLDRLLGRTNRLEAPHTTAPSPDFRCMGPSKITSPDGPFSKSITREKLKSQ